MAYGGDLCGGLGVGLGVGEVPVGDDGFDVRQDGALKGKADSGLIRHVCVLLQVTDEWAQECMRAVGALLVLIVGRRVE